MAKLIQLLIIHCTATPEGRPVTPQEIRDWHTWPKLQPNGKLRYMGKDYSSDDTLPAAVRNKRGRGWRQVGYSDLILLSGNIANLVKYNDDNIVDPWEITNGVAGINGEARHIVYAGGTDAKGKPKDTRTAAQAQTLLQYCKNMIKLYPHIKIGGHNQFDKKDCPSFDVPSWLRKVGIPEKNIYAN
jgi:N-acetylmuramoyl-L-alanine amidase